jgi:uncharacterized membrane protein YbhN (UPF0104 family)
MTRRRWLLFGLKASVSVGLIAWLLYQANLSEAAERARALSVGAAIAVIALLCAYIALGAVRWLVALRAIGCRPGIMETTRITFIGVFFSQFLPATVGGDAVRVWECHRGGLGIAPAIHSVLLERVAYLFALSLLAAAGLSLWSRGRLPEAVVPAAWLVFVAASGLVLALAGLDRLPGRFLPPALVRSAERLAADSRKLFASLPSALALLLSAIAGQALLALAVFVLAGALEIPVALIDCAVLLPAIVLVSSLPISLAGWGVREYAMVTGLAFAEVPTASALALSLTFALLYVLASATGGILWLLRRKVPSSTSSTG